MSKALHNHYREWTDDLESTVDNMLDLINQACDKFVQEIQEGVIMVNIVKSNLY